MRSDLPKNIRMNESGIVNLDDAEGKGTHWTAYIKRGIKILYFDSIGQIKPPLELIRYFKSDGGSNRILYNYDKYQKLNTHNCGQLVLRFLYDYSR